MTEDRNETDISREDEAFLKQEFLPAVEDLTDRFVKKATEVAQSEGWRPDLAEAIAVLGTAPFLEGLLSDVPPEEAVETGMRQGKHRMLGELFKAEIDNGVDLHTAFRRILDLQAENAERIGETPTQLPEAWVTTALAELDAAAAANQSPEEQVMAGLRSIAVTSLGDAIDVIRSN